MKKFENLYIEDAIESAQKAIRYLNNVSYEEFMSGDEMVRDAILRCVEIVGEALKNIDKEMRDQNPQIPWRSAIGMRDKVIHDYGWVEWRTVYNTVKDDYPKLIAMLSELV
ncbi:MAG: DUF86 domain-containing protein [Candidatus Ancillula sp.]|jgi:uncharacterized protein with HEPN domain|nr:DUF86 domain-containing protein [Candidatus Ancillula sp.]